MSAFTFPQPGDGRTNAAAIPVPERVLANVVTYALTAYYLHRCSDLECRHCTNAHASITALLWLLPDELQALVFQYLDANMDYGTPLEPIGEAP